MPPKRNTTTRTPTTRSTKTARREKARKDLDYDSGPAVDTTPKGQRTKKLRSKWEDVSNSEPEEQVKRPDTVQKQKKADLLKDSIAAKTIDRTDRPDSEDRPEGDLNDQTRQETHSLSDSPPPREESVADSDDDLFGHQNTSKTTR